MISAIFRLSTKKISIKKPPQTFSAEVLCLKVYMDTLGNISHATSLPLLYISCFYSTEILVTALPKRTFFHKKYQIHYYFTHYTIILINIPKNSKAFIVKGFTVIAILLYIILPVILSILYDRESILFS